MLQVGSPCRWGSEYCKNGVPPIDTTIGSLSKSCSNQKWNPTLNNMYVRVSPSNIERVQSTTADPFQHHRTLTLQEQIVCVTIRPQSKRRISDVIKINTYMLICVIVAILCPTKLQRRLWKQFCACLCSFHSPSIIESHAWSKTTVLFHRPPGHFHSRWLSRTFLGLGLHKYRQIVLLSLLLQTVYRTISTSE